MITNSLFKFLEGVVPEEVIRLASCIPGTNPADAIRTAMEIVSFGRVREHQFTTTDAFEFYTNPGTSGTLAISGDPADTGVTWALEYFLDDHWEAFDTQPDAGFFDIRVQWPTTKARLTPNVVVNHIDVLAVS